MVKMKNILIFTLAAFSLFACNAKKKVENTDDLPKDIALKPENNLSQQQDKDELTVAIKKIDSLAQSETCSNVADFAFTSIGAKPCGGPSSYIAYPKKVEAEILPQIQKFTTMQFAFNKKYNLMSDCALVPEPTGISCENGKAVLVNKNSGDSQVQ